MKILHFLYVIIPLLLISCADRNSANQPDDLIDETTYQDLIIELQMIKAHNTVSSGEVHPDSAKMLIFAEYDVSEEQFLQSNEYYQQQVDPQIKRINQAIGQLKKEQDLLKSYVDSLRADTVISDSLK